MTSRNRILIVIALLTLPVLLRILFFYQFPYWNTNIQVPDYSSYSISEPPTPSSTVKPAAGIADGKVVLVDNTHGNQFRLDEIEPLVTALSARGARVEFDQDDDLLASRLKYASAYLVFSPSVSFTAGELLLIRQFIANGGRLLVFADPTRGLVDYDFFGNGITFPDVNYANPVIAPFGLSFYNDYIYNLKDNEGNFRNVEFSEFVEDPLTRDLNMVVFYGAHSVHTDSGTALALGAADSLSSLTDQGGGLTAMALSTNGQVLAMGDFTFLTSPFNLVADNNLLLSHVADFAISAERTPSLANFPFVFQRPVSLVSTSGVELSSDLLGPIAALQQSLKAVNIPVSVSPKPSKDGDTILLGTFSASDELNPYLRPFNISLDESGSVDLPAFGMLEQNGNGLLLFNQGPKTNTLILLVNRPSDLPALVTLVASGDLSSCVVQGAIGVCSLDSDSSDGFDSGFDEFGNEFDQTTVEEPAPEPFLGP
jgi:hypothetical protein